MTRTTRAVHGGMLLLCWTLGAAPAAAQPPGDDGEGKVIVSLGMGVYEGLEVKPEYLPIIEPILRQAIAMGRFETIRVGAQGPVPIEQFLDRYGALLRQQAAPAGGEPAEEPAWAKDLAAIARSVFVYELTLASFDASVVEDSHGVAQAQVRMSVALDIYHLDLSDPLAPRAKRVASLGKFVPQVARAPLNEQQSLDTKLRSVVRQCARQVGTELALEIRRLPQFQLMARIEQIEPGQVVIPMGKRLGIQLDDAFDIHRLDPQGGDRIVGYAKVRRVESDSSVAQDIVVKEGPSFAAGDRAVEHPMAGVGLSLAGLLEVTAGDLLGGSGAGVYPGFDLGVEIDMAPALQVPEFYLVVDLDHLFPGRSADPSLFVSLGHVTLGLLKKWYFRRLAIDLGLQGGFSYYIYDDSGFDDPAGHIGFGGDLLLGAEVFLTANVSLFVRLRGRYFTNPLVWASGPDEAGLSATAGLLISF